MANRMESSSQIMALLWQTLIPLVIAGGATGILSIFKQDLPSPLYNIFLYVIWGSIILMLIWLVLRLILGDPKQFLTYIRLKLKKRTELRLVKNWRVTFFVLYKMIDRLTDNEWQYTTEDNEQYL